MESFYRNDESCLLGVHLSELDRSLIGLCTTPSEKAILQIPWRDIRDHTSQDATQWIDELLRWHRIVQELRLDSSDDLRV